MTRDEFWQIVERSETPEALHAELTPLSEEELASFERHHDAVDREGYDWGLWGAAYVILGGCGDDSFDYFRAFLISLGRSVYESAVADPDSLAAVDRDLADEDDHEAWMSPTMAVVHERTGQYGFASTEPSPPRLDPTGEEWEEDDLDARFPRLAAKYG